MMKDKGCTAITDLFTYNVTQSEGLLSKRGHSKHIQASEEFIESTL